MPRPKVPRYLLSRPEITYYKPVGVPLRLLSETVLFPEETEALKLYELDGYDQKESARHMGISQPTFARILGSAYKKISAAILTGKAIRIEPSIR